VIVHDYAWDRTCQKDHFDSIRRSSYCRLCHNVLPALDAEWRKRLWSSLTLGICMAIIGSVVAISGVRRGGFHSHIHIWYLASFGRLKAAAGNAGGSSRNVKN
jgi:hypothetical protein